MVKYFHIGVNFIPMFEMKINSVMGYNYEEKFLMNSIIKPCLKGKEFSVKGKWINPQRDQLKEIQVFKTDEKLRDVKIAQLDLIVAGEGISSQTMMVANVEHELVTDMFLTSKLPTPQSSESVKKEENTNGLTREKKMINYNELDNDEQIALEVAIAYPNKSLTEILPHFYGYNMSKSTLYRYHQMGVTKLSARGFLDRQGRPTEPSFEIFPFEKIKKIALSLHVELVRLDDEKNKAIAAKYLTEDELKKIKKQAENLETSLRNANQQLTMFNEDKVKSVLKTFNFLGVDENWVSVLAALNLIEIAMRQKAKSLGIDPNGKFNETLDALRKAVKEKEGRELDSSSAFLRETDLYSFRSKIDHFGLKKKVSDKEADFIIEQAHKFIDTLKLS